MCMGGGIGQGIGQVAGVMAEQQNPGFRSGMFPQNGPNNSLGVPYTYGAGFPVVNTPSSNLANNAIGNQERERRKTASPDSYGRAIWGKKPSQAKGQVANRQTSSASPKAKDKRDNLLGGGGTRKEYTGGGNADTLERKTLLGA